MKLKSLILIELTCPAEEGIVPAQLRKESRYTHLVDAIQDNNRSWSIHLMTIEVGARGYVARTLPRCLKRLGLSPRMVSRVCRDASTVAARCTYAIYLSHGSEAWDPNRPLLALDTGLAACPEPQPGQIR